MKKLYSDIVRTGTFRIRQRTSDALRSPYDYMHNKVIVHYVPDRNIQIRWHVGDGWTIVKTGDVFHFSDLRRRLYIRYSPIIPTLEFIDIEMIEDEDFRGNILPYSNYVDDLASIPIGTLAEGVLGNNIFISLPVLYVYIQLNPGEIIDAGDRIRLYRGTARLTDVTFQTTGTQFGITDRTQIPTGILSIMYWNSHAANVKNTLQATLILQQR